MQPVTSLEGEPWRAALNEGRLLIQVCAGCGRRRLYPSPMCPACQSMDVTWQEASRAGVLHSWTITHQTGLPGFSERVPYAILTVDLAEGVRLLAPLAGRDFERLHVGLAVRLEFESAEDGATRPVFVL